MWRSLVLVAVILCLVYLLVGCGGSSGLGLGGNQNPGDVAADEGDGIAPPTPVEPPPGPPAPPIF